ncbi:MAG: ATP-binding cassette domain-containing protein [Sedimentisphaerales bacterium]
MNAEQQIVNNENAGEVKTAPLPGAPGDIKPDDGIIVLKNIARRFGNNIVLDDISLAIEKGKTTVVIGPSGCGKSVLLKLMIVLLRPTSGQVYFKGQRIDELDDKHLNGIRAHFGYLFQSGALFAKQAQNGGIGRSSAVLPRQSFRWTA